MVTPTAGVKKIAAHMAMKPEEWRKKEEDSAKISLLRSVDWYMQYTVQTKEHPHKEHGPRLI
jgi:hypothetical protein